MSIGINRLGLQCLSAISLVCAFHAGCVSSAPSRPSAAGNAGAGAGPGAGGNAGKGSAGKSGTSGGRATNGGDENAAGQGTSGAGATESSGGSGGTGGMTGGGATTSRGGRTGSGARGGTGGRGGSGNTESGAGASGSDESGGAGAGGEPGSMPTCGKLGSACCDGSCDANLACLDGSACSCIQGIFGSYLVHANGTLMQEEPSPQPVLSADTGTALEGVVDGAAGLYHGCAVLSDRSVACWATNANGNLLGQLGNGSTGAAETTYRASTVLTGPATPLRDVVSLARSVGANNTCAITGAGGLYCWGDLTWVVGNGTTTPSAYAQQITSDGLNPLTGVDQAAVTNGGACAVTTGTASHELWCWGYNYEYELAEGDRTNRQYPVKIDGLDDPTFVAMDESSSNGSHAVCVVDGAGVLCWGLADYGETGQGTTPANTDTPMPVLIDSTTHLSGVVDLTPGNVAMCARRTDASFWCWGYGYPAYATKYGASDVVAVSTANGAGGPNGPRYLTSDGVYHAASAAVAPTCP